MALESWYINVLSCYPEVRGKGIGSRLLQLSEEIARAEWLDRLSVIVASDNVGARRLYDRHGFKEVARKVCVKEDWATATDHWILLARSISRAEPGTYRRPTQDVVVGRGTQR